MKEKLYRIELFLNVIINADSIRIMLVIILPVDVFNCPINVLANLRYPLNSSLYKSSSCSIITN